MTKKIEEKDGEKQTETNPTPVINKVTIEVQPVKGRFGSTSDQIVLLDSTGKKMAGFYQSQADGLLLAMVRDGAKSVFDRIKECSHYMDLEKQQRESEVGRSKFRA